MGYLGLLGYLGYLGYLGLLRLFVCIGPGGLNSPSCLSEKAEEYGGLKITDWRQASNRGNGSRFPLQAK